MKKGSRPSLKFGVLACAAFVSAGGLTVRAQLAPAPSAVAAISSVSLASFEPTPNVVNPTFPVTLPLRHTLGAASAFPVHYRFSRFADFHDASWLPYTAAPSAQIPAAWFETLPNNNRRVVLHFQVRATNPKAGRPIGFVNKPLSEQKTLQVEPPFLNSNARSATTNAVFAN